MMEARASLFGFQHQNENLERDTFLGNISPLLEDLSLKILLVIFTLELNGILKWVI